MLIKTFASYSNQQTSPESDPHPRTLASSFPGINPFTETLHNNTAKNAAIGILLKLSASA